MLQHPSFDLSRAIVRTVLVLLAGPLLAILLPGQAEANVVCLIDNAELEFGTSPTGTGTIDYTCTNYSYTPRSFALCVGLGNPSWPGTPQQPVLRSGNRFAGYQVFEDPALSQRWTAQRPLTKLISMPAGMASSVSGSFQFYGAIASGQTPVPDTYSAFFYNTVLGTPDNGGQCRTSGNTGFSFSAQQFTLSLGAQIANACRIVATGNADLGSVSAARGPVFGTGSIAVNCPSGTSFNIGLEPSNGHQAGFGDMSGSPGNSDTVPYQLRSGSSTGPIWGATASSTNVGNGVSGTGNGNTQDYSVYVTVPDTDVTPDSYSDTVRVTVHF
ncbi:Csu type fimbrial protein [Aurantiacibacter zhengii]|nr:spore coat protein U domain-containing protein [Aurantiacibacter zhengii]